MISASICSYLRLKYTVDCNWLEFERSIVEGDGGLVVERSPREREVVGSIPDRVIP